MNINLTGLEELQGKLKDLGHRARTIDGNHTVLLSELLTPSFLRHCSRFSSLVELQSAGGFTVRSSDDYAALSDQQRDAFIRDNTSYSTWEQMVESATREWTKKQLGL